MDGPEEGESCLDLGAEKGGKPVDSCLVLGFE